MISYLLNTILCSGLLLLAYHFLLKNKAIYNFNRVYLLFGLLFSLIIPLIVVKQNIAPVLSLVPVQAQIISNDLVIVPATNHPDIVRDSTWTINWIFICKAIYTLITFTLFLRFIINLYSIRKSILNNQQLSYKHTMLVLIDKNLTPHTFFNYIFLNKQTYQNGQVEDRILQHELAHAAQWHSADVLFIELLQVFYWVNPMLFFYRHAIQLNHEFIADGQVLKADNDIKSYQTLLINKLTNHKSLAITSQFNFSVTKNRLIMMTKTTSVTTAWISRLAVAPVIVCAFILFCNKTEAGEIPKGLNIFHPKVTQNIARRDTLKIDTSNNPVWPFYPHTKGGAPTQLIAEYQAIIAKYGPPDKIRVKQIRTITSADKAQMETIFKQMSLKQQQAQYVGFSYPRGILKPSKPTESELNSWKNSKAYGVWINEKRVNNKVLANYTTDDFGQVMISRLTKWAVLNDGFNYQINLMTADYYKKYRKQALDDRYNSFIYYHLMTPPPPPK